MEQVSVSTNVILSSSDDNEVKQDDMPRIINTISLRGTSVSFQDEAENDFESLLYPDCEIKEENDPADTNNIDRQTEDKKISESCRETDMSNIKKEKKKVKLSQLSTVNHERGPKPSTSRKNEYNVVDAGKLALQESLFKTKELFDTFLRVCQDQENSEQMEKVVQKLTRSYEQTKQEFLGSLAFQNILESETEKVNTSNTKPWLNLKLVLDEMKHNKKLTLSKLKLGESEESQDAGAASNEDEPIIECPKKRRHLKKLEKTLRALNLKIKKLEEKEVDLDDDDSSYIKLDRYRTQFTKVYNKVCEIKGKLPDADRPYLRKVSFAGTTYPHINRCIERFYNKHREFPDFQDIKKLVIMANKAENIEMAPIKIHQMAAAAFKEFGEMLKRLRQYDDYDVIISYLDQQVDPARDDEVLQEELAKNALLFKKREQEVIDKFADEDAGIRSDSEEDVESKKQKKKRKIIITNPRKRPEAPKKNLSSSSSSDDEEEEKQIETNKSTRSVPFLSDSEKSDSQCESDKKVNKGLVSKGKVIAGKKRFVKRSIKPPPSKKAKVPQTAISSDEEVAPKNTKDTLTNYLGLKSMTSQTLKTENPETKEESDIEITCIKEIQKSPPENNVQEKFYRKISIESSDSDTKKTKSRPIQEINVPSDNSDSDVKKPAASNTKLVNSLEISESSSSSDIEPIAVVEKSSKQNKNSTRKTDSEPKSAFSSRLKPNTTNSRKNNSLPPISESSDDSSDDRTSDEESDNSITSKSLSDVELSTGTKDLSSDSSDNDDARKKEKKLDKDDAIVILSEDVVEEVKKTNKSSEASSDSDDICILSSKEEKKPIPPWKNRIEEGNNIRKPTTQNSSSIISPRRKTGVATSTPKKEPAAVMKRRLSNQSSNGNIKKKPRQGGGPLNNVNGKQSTLPQIINGASRKVFISRISNPSSRCSSQESIPLIELD